jgi:hypothetical protein
MNQWFRFGAVGTYVLTIRMSRGAETVEGAVLPITDGTAWLEITPRDPMRLEKECATLAGKVENTLSVEEWQFPARMLASIDDRIAIPYLSRVLATNKGAENIVIPALERIGGDDAVEVLLSALGNKSGEVAELARQSLARMQGQITNPSVRKAVKQALASKAG